jgi:carbamoyltransferase
MYTLGINAVYHDPAACLVKDGQVIAAAEEERFTHVKHGKRPIPFSTYELPFHAIDYCLREAGITLPEVEHIAYSYDPYLLLLQYPQTDRRKSSNSVPLPALPHMNNVSTNIPKRSSDFALGTHSVDATITLPLEPSSHPTPAEWESSWDPLFLSSIVNAPRHLAGGAPLHLQARLRGYKSNGPTQWHFVEHHTAHAASAFHASPYTSAAIMTLDGRGERATTSYNIGEGNALQRLGQVNMPHSLGLLYEEVTEYLGFLRSSDEYKVMALASFGKPTYLSEFREMVQMREEGQYIIALTRLVERFGPARLKGGPLEQRHYDIAHSLQVVLEDTALALANWLYETTRLDTLCLAGGTALNCVMNARLRDRGPFKHIWVQPAANDAGTALGAALWIDAQERKTQERAYVMDHAYLGPQFSDDEIEQFLRWSKLPYKRLDNIAEQAADILMQDRVIGWYQYRMEFGPRALGARSILASPIHAEMQARLNDIKDREDFRPVAPVVLEEEAAQWFHNADVSPFMLFVYDVLPDKADLIPAVRHIDGTARIQTINRAQHALYYDVIKAFQNRSGVPVLINTSFNTRGEPIVCTPRDAIESFWTSPLDALVIGSFLLEKPYTQA